MFLVGSLRPLQRLVTVTAAVGTLLLLASLPATAQGSTGQTLVGKVVRAYVEHATMDAPGARADFAAPLTWIASPAGTTVRVPTSALADVPVGTTVSVTVGSEVSDTATTDDHLHPAQQIVSSAVVAPASTTAGPATAAGTTLSGASVTDSVTVAMVAPAGSSPDLTTLAQVVSQVAGPVAQFWSTQSGGAVQIGVADTHDWMTTSADCSDPEGLWAEVSSKIGFVAGPGKHLMLYVPSTDSQCSLGLAEVGASLHGGGSLYVQSIATSVIAHELGHNFGLLHSRREECQGSVESNPCTTIEYGDFYDVMGASWDEVGSLNDVQAARLGFLPEAEVQALTPASASAAYALAPLSASTGIRGIRLTAASGDVDYLEYRAASGEDSYLADPTLNYVGLQSGVLVHKVENASAADSAILLDPTPSPGTDFAADDQDAFPIGVPVPVDGGQFTVDVTGVSASAATITITPHSLRLPMGSLDAVTVSGGTLSANGWEFDPDVPTTIGEVDVYLDGSGVPLIADNPRPDVGAAFPAAGSQHGFTFSTPVGPGPHTLCAYAIDSTKTGNTPLGCRTVA